MQGRFIIELEEDAWYNLLFSPKNLAAIIIYDIPADTKDLKVTLPQGGTINGRLLRMKEGQKIPIPNAEVELKETSRGSYTHLGFAQDRKMFTDSEGRFRFEHIRTKIRADRYEPKYKPREWEISYGDVKKTVEFADNEKTLKVELVVNPD